jgi:Fe2+ or Zn2+ uptake regulation protein
MKWLKREDSKSDLNNWPKTSDPDRINPTEWGPHKAFVCDICKESKEIGKNMSWDGKFNGSIGAGYKTDIVDGKVRNICKKCQ